MRLAQHTAVLYETPDISRILAALSVAVLLTASGCARWLHPRPHLLSSALSQPADGREHRIATLGNSLRADDLRMTGVPSNRVRIENEPDRTVTIYLRTPVQPGALHLTLSSSGNRLPLTVTLLPDNSDSFGDGTPDFLRLHSLADRQAFRRWFTELAERAADTPDAKLPPEIIDCASLLRYAYREALRAHDARWYAQFPPEAMPPLPSVSQWTYPDTPLGDNIFRVRPGVFQAADLQGGAFAQFADAKTLYSLNAHLLGRSLKLARPGDLIFYRVLGENSQYHSMVITGEQSEWVVYHTGPIEGHRGEIRRVLLADLLRHPDPRWRPLPGNPNFLGVYRWNILRE